MADPILVAQHGDIECHLLPALANRHGLITGATGTGKTITLQTLAENFSRIGVPVFMADVKGDLTGISQAGSIGAKLAARAEGARHRPRPSPLACPATLWDVFGEQGHPVRATVSDMGPLLLARMLELNETQAGVLQPGLQDRRRQRPAAARPEGPARDAAARGRQRQRSSPPSTATSAPASIGAIQRGLLQIDEQGGDQFFGEPMLNIADFMQTDGRQGRGQHPRRRQADERAAAVRHLPAVDAVRAVRAAARGRRPRQAQAGVLLRRGAPAVQRRADGAGRAHRAGGAAGAHQGRGRVLRDAEPAGHSRHRAGAAGQPRAARAARLHAARPEGGEGGGRAPCAPTRSWTSRPRSPSWPSARRWSASSTRRAGPASPSASSCCRRAARSGRSRPSSARR